jgi:hypothetical protein
VSARARVEWDGRRWIAVLDTGGVTQARQLDQLPERLAEVHELMTGQAIRPDDIELDIDFPGAAAAAAVRANRARLSAAESELAEATAAAVAELRARDVSMRDVATMVGVSHQRVQQLAARAVRRNGVRKPSSALDRRRRRSAS